MFSEYQRIDFLAHQAQFFYVGIQFLYVIGIYKVQVIMLTDVYNMYLFIIYTFDFYMYYIRKKLFVIYQYHIYLSPNQRKCYIRYALGCPQQRWPSAGVHGCCCDERYNPTFPE